LVTAVNKDKKSDLKERKLIVTVNNQELNNKFFYKIPEGERELYERNNVLLAHSLKSLGIDGKTSVVVSEKNTGIKSQIEFVKDAEGAYSAYIEGKVIPELLGKTQLEIINTLNKDYNIQDEYEIKTK